MVEIRLPYEWHTRAYQAPAWRALSRGIKRAMLVWPRRHGKDTLAMHWTATEAMLRPANYVHLLPLATEARRAIWDFVDPHTHKRRIDEVFPREIRSKTLDDTMTIRFVNGSTWQVGGSDNYMAYLGAGPAGIVFSEYAYGDPNAFQAFRPMLLENNGWAIFPSTPNGRNHFFRLYEEAISNPHEWFAEKLSYRDCGIFTDEQIEKERRSQAAERGSDDEANAIIGQWYLCSFDAPVLGSYYGALLVAAENAGRITEVPYDPRYPVDTGWDLGVGDSTAIWFAQELPARTHLIDYYEASGVGADHYARVLKDKGYGYGRHYLPHDADDREWGNNASSRVDTLKSLGVKPCKVLPRVSVDDGINAVRIMLQRAYIDRGRCERGLDALRQYQRTWDEKLRIFSSKPLHDWSSHGADGLRTYAQGARDEYTVRQTRQPREALM